MTQDKLSPKYSGRFSLLLMGIAQSKRYPIQIYTLQHTGIVTI